MTRSSDLQQCVYWYVLVQKIASMQSLDEQFNDESGIYLLWMELLHQLDGGLHAASGGQQVVMDEHTVGGVDCVRADFDAVLAVFPILSNISLRRFLCVPWVI